MAIVSPLVIRKIMNAIGVKGLRRSDDRNCIEGDNMMPIPLADIMKAPDENTIANMVLDRMLGAQGYTEQAATVPADMAAQRNRAMMMAKLTPPPSVFTPLAGGLVSGALSGPSGSYMIWDDQLRDSTDGLQSALDRVSGINPTAKPSEIKTPHSIRAALDECDKLIARLNMKVGVLRTMVVDASKLELSASLFIGSNPPIFDTRMLRDSGSKDRLRAIGEMVAGLAIAHAVETVIDLTEKIEESNLFAVGGNLKAVMAKAADEGLTPEDMKSVTVVITPIEWPPR